MTVLLEISEFIGNPVRTGIQRVVRELIAKWPADRSMRCCAYAPEADTLYELPDRAVALACAGATTTSIDESELKHRIAEADPPVRRRPVPADEGPILIPEVFYDPNRIGFYRRLERNRGIAPAVIVHDFAAYFDPDAFKIAATGSNFFLPYLYFVRNARARAFTNAIVADDYRARIVRRAYADPADAVIRLGSDGLGLARQRWAPARRTIVCLGSFDGKKNQQVLYEAYRTSPALRDKLELLFIGRKPEAWQGSHFASLLADDQFSGRHILANASDEDVRDAFARARATAFLGTSEGFGLPAVESLAAGIPLVAWAKLPALSGLPADGQIRLGAVTVEATRAALERLLDDEATERLWDGAATLRLETWADYASAIADWVAA